MTNKNIAIDIALLLIGSLSMILLLSWIEGENQEPWMLAVNAVAGVVNALVLRFMYRRYRQKSSH